MSKATCNQNEIKDLKRRIGLIEKAIQEITRILTDFAKVLNKEVF